MRRTSTYWKWVGALGAVFVPSAVLALTIPHEFQAGDPIVSADVNANFSAIATAVNDIEDRVDDVEAGLGGLGLSCTTVEGEDELIQPDAVGTTFVNCESEPGILTGGGCRTGTESGGIAFGPSYGFMSSTDNYICRFHNTYASVRAIRAYARCCSVGS
jgi:hypothetical protein